MSITKRQIMKHKEEQRITRRLKRIADMKGRCEDCGQPDAKEFWTGEETLFLCEDCIDNFKPTKAEAPYMPDFM